MSTDLANRAQQLAGVPAAPGLALGRAHWLRSAAATVERRPIDDPDAELGRLGAARRVARAELEALHAQVSADLNLAEGAIFEAHLAFLDDPALFDELEALCRAERVNVEFALAQVIDGYRAMLQASDDPIFQARAADLEDIKQRLLRLLGGGAGHGALDLPAEPCIILAADLLPSTAVQLDRSRVLGFCLSEGGATSHVAILARGLGLPALVGLGSALEPIADGTLLALDGSAGTLLVDPAEPEAQAFAQRMAVQQQLRLAQLGAAAEPAVTRDGLRVGVLANLSSLAEAEVAVECGAEGVGLLRTELLFIDRAQAPGEAEQTALYRAIADAIGRRPLTIRTLDIGGDKPVAYIRQPPEPNPALGVRGIRLARSEPELLRGQLRAIWRVGPGYQLRVMFPMVASLSEVRWLRSLVDELGAELRAAGEPIADRLEVGVMVEIPALAVIADQVAPLVDFMSIGTNDLTQYLIAVDRTNAAVSDLGDALHPAVLRLIGSVAEAGRASGCEVSVCGELAGDPSGAAALVGLGVTKLSMSPQLIPGAKAALRRLDSARCAAEVAAGLGLDSAQDVRAHLARLSA